MVVTARPRVLALDEGDVYARVEVAVGDLTLEELRVALVEASSQLLIQALEEGLGEPEPQSGEVTYARKLKADEFVLDFTQPAMQLARTIRLGRAHTTVMGKRLAIKAAKVAASDGSAPSPTAPAGTLDGVRVATGDGWLVLEMVQPEGKKPISALDWQRGARLDAETVLGT